MCGIAGIIDLRSPQSQDQLLAMSQSLANRGPDDLGILAQDPVGLVHRRLSIIDLAGGHQPIYNEDRSLAIVCNGEIYDFCELRNELRERGHVFSTESDSEVILHLYEEDGPACLERLNGMYAFAIAHLASGELFIARDRFGQKPLFFAESAGRFAFASGPKALATLPWVDDSLDVGAIHDYLEYLYVPCPRSVFCGVRKLPPGHYGIWKDGRWRQHRYWQACFREGFAGDYADAQVAVDKSLQRAVKRRMVADVPVGLFLSGGLDSSIVTALAAAQRPVKSFSIGFPETAYDERRYAAEVAKHLGTEHHFLEVQPENFSLLEKAVGFYEEPFSDSSLLPTCLLSQFTREHVTVALGGDGADELFGGYYRFRVAHLMRHLDAIPAPLRCALRRALLAGMPPRTEERSAFGKLRRLIELVGGDELGRYRSTLSRFPESLRAGLYGPAMREAASKAEGAGVLAYRRHDHRLLVDALMELDCVRYLPDDILVKVDRASMAYGLEVRSPFLDREVAELAFSLPYAWKQQGRVRKRVLVDAFDGRLPKGIATRSKMGFGVPVAAWLRGPWHEPVRTGLLDGQLVSQGLFDRAALDRLLSNHVVGKADHSYAIFSLLMLGLWLDQR
ncbi:MAG: asparagine synthase (glutamine-hydrolyzing) [Rhodothermales bacterium]|jgi:asparagine synthase (glutamine-hydrolysing)